MVQVRIRLQCWLQTKAAQQAQQLELLDLQDNQLEHRNDEVRPEDPGVPHDPPGPDVPGAPGGTEVPDVPINPETDQPAGTDEVDGADYGHGGISDDEGEPD